MFGGPSPTFLTFAILAALFLAVAGVIAHMLRRAYREEWSPGAIAAVVLAATAIFAVVATVGLVLFPALEATLL